MSDKFNNAIQEHQANVNEKTFGEEMSESDLAHQLGEGLPEYKEQKTLTEEEMDNSNDIYKVKARVVNLASGNGGNLTPQGEILVNCFVHVLKSLYDFAEKLQEPTKTELTNLIKSQEGMPGDVIMASMRNRPGPKR